jgi:protein-L-isoaspartate(D-aspartate) O-methyltransferase
MPGNRIRIAGRLLACIPLIASLMSPTAAVAEDEYGAMRRRLRAEIEQDAAATADSTGRPRFSARVMDAIDAVPRHSFVPARELENAYENRPLPIGYGQTISQPYIVALMTELLEPKSGDIVLEVGTGSGYQAAVLAKLVARVYTIEIVPPLAKSAALRLEKLGYANIEIRLGDGYHGWREHGPFDGIIVTAAANVIPPPLIEQLKPGGRMLIPVGAPFFAQELIVLTKDVNGKVSTRSVLPVAFVPLTGSR